MPDGANNPKEVGTEGEAVPQPRADIPWSGSRGQTDGLRLAPSIRRNDRETRRIAVYTPSRPELHPNRQVRYLRVGLSEDMRIRQTGPDHKGPLWSRLWPAKQCGTSIPSRCLTAPSSWGTNSIQSFPKSFIAASFVVTLVPAAAEVRPLRSHCNVFDRPQAVIRLVSP